MTGATHEFIPTETPPWYIDPHATCYQFAQSGSVVLTISFNPFRIKVADGVELDEAAALFIAEIKRQAGQLEPDDDDRQEKNRQLARLGAAMPRVVGR